MELKYLGINTLQYDAKKCRGCGMCPIVCPMRMFKMNGRKAELTMKKKCIECGACMRNCPYDAIYVDAGPGCAGAVLSSKLGGKKEACCG
jgi:Fe-S-cluster-containing hydrogenase component 2